MSKVLVAESYLEDIADAIREKLEVQTTYRPGDMAAAIESISGGYPEPTGTINITQNGVVNVKDYASADVNVQGGGGASNILSGTDVPSVSQGSDGNIYLRYADIPAGYTVLDFIASSGTQYIDTGIIGETDVEVQMDFSLIESVGQWCVMFGSFTANLNNSFAAFINGLATLSYQRGSGVYQDVSYALALDTPYTFRTRKNKLYVNDVETHSLSNYLVTTPSTITLSAVHKGNAIDMYAPAHRIYGAKIWKENVLARWFVPCKRNSDNVPGLYDIIGNQFYVSGSSTDYSAGNTITFDDNSVLDAYLKVNGAWQELIGSDIDDVGGVSV